MKIGERIKLIRKERRLTQRELADTLEVSAAAIRQFEKGEVLRSSTLDKLADALSVPVSFFVDPYVNPLDLPEDQERIARLLNKDRDEEDKRLAELFVEQNPSAISLDLDPGESSLIQLYRELTVDNRDKALDYIRYLIERQK